MGFHHFDDDDDFLQNHHFASNPVPKFNFPTKTHTPVPPVIKATTDAIKTFISSTFETLNEKEVTTILPTEIITTTNAPAIVEEKVTEILTTAIPPMIEETTVQQVIDSVTRAISDGIDSSAVNETLILNENNFNNRSIVAAVTESINNTGIFETMNNGSVLLSSNTSTTVKNDDVNGVATTLADIVTNTTEKAVTIIQTTTEKVMDIFASTVSAESHGEHDNDTKHFNHDTGSHSGLYVILGIILTILLVMCIVFIYAYMRYRKSNSHSLLHHPYYNVSPKKENVPTPSDHQQSCLNDVYVQYTC
ncbi:hypothetical protein FQR65_LT04785 [Abscondita terminalis]|nr:hypothetical protein FQR65_LT04785 [Abscondita terminalis]